MALIQPTSSFQVIRIKMLKGKNINLRSQVIVSDQAANVSIEAWGQQSFNRSQTHTLSQN